MKNVAVVTGGAGFIGRHLVDELLARDYEVRVIDNLVAGKREQVPDGAAFFEADVRDRATLSPICIGARVIFHLAALPRVEYSIQNPIETHDVNATGTLNVLLAAQASGVRRVILASSAAIYGSCERVPFLETLPPEPLSPYALHKLISEEYLKLFSRLYGLQTASLRFFNVYGPRLDPEGPYALVIGRFLKLRALGETLTITGDGAQTRDFIHVRDVVRAIILAGESRQAGGGEVINIGTGKETSLNELADLFGGKRVYVEARKEPRASRADIRRAKELLAWEPSISLPEGIAELKRERGL